MDFHLVVEQPLGFDTKKSACRGEDVHLFYPNADQKNSEGGVRKFQLQAIQLCNKCEVKDPCLEYAIKFEPLGIWGGTTEVEREFMRREKEIMLPEGRKMSDYARRAVRRERDRQRRYTK